MLWARRFVRCNQPQISITQPMETLPAAFIVAQIRQINMLPNYHQLLEAKWLPARATHNTTCIRPGEWQAKPWGTLQQSAWWFDLVKAEPVPEKTRNLHEWCANHLSNHDLVKWREPLASLSLLLMVFYATFVLQHSHVFKTKFTTTAVWFNFPGSNYVDSVNVDNSQSFRL